MITTKGSKNSSQSASYQSKVKKKFEFQTVTKITKLLIQRNCPRRTLETLSASEDPVKRAGERDHRKQNKPVLIELKNLNLLN